MDVASIPVYLDTRQIALLFEWVVHEDGCSSPRVRCRCELPLAPDTRRARRWLEASRILIRIGPHRLGTTPLLLREAFPDVYDSIVATRPEAAEW